MRRILEVLLVACVGMAAADAPSAADAVALVRAAAQPLTGGARDYDALLDTVGAAHIVMLGEATHGSREFYRERAHITRRLIEEKGFHAVVFEAPWQPMRRLDAYVRGAGGDADAAAALADIVRFPVWTWRNEEVRDFAEWLRRHNRQAGAAAVRVYGMDLYSVPESARAVAAYLALSSPQEAAAAMRDYRCFDDYLEEPQDYGHAVVVSGRPACGAGARRQLGLMQASVALAEVPDEALFAAWQSAHTVAAGEAYYRAMYRQGISSWNVRERHMADTLDRLLGWLSAVAGSEAKIVVWAHNIHQGDARATDQAAAGEFSLGQTMRERHEGSVVLVGFTTHSGRVRAASGWGQRDRIKRLRPALAGSWTALLHGSGLPAFLLTFAGDPALATAFADNRLERAVGVTYLPHDERASHYFNMRLSRQFDAVIHLDVTSSVTSLPNAGVVRTSTSTAGP